MKFKYLPAEDKKNIRMLRHNNDPNEIPKILNSVFQRPFTLQALWEYRKWYYLLRNEDFEKYPSLRLGFYQIKVFEGKINEAKEILKTLPENSYYEEYCSLVSPGLTPKEYKEHVKTIKDKNYGPIPNMTLTAGRPSVFSGIWDFSDFIDPLIDNNHYLDEEFNTLFLEKGYAVREVLIAEILYQRDECYEALVKIVGLIPTLKDRKDMRLLFSALTLEIFIMVLNNQIASSNPMIDTLRKQIVGVGLEEYIPNIDALEAWAAMYDGDYKKITKWLRENAPDEHSKFCMLDVFRYFVKMRVYLIQGKYLAITLLASRLQTLLEDGMRYRDFCELKLLWAMSDYARGDKEAALNHLAKALEIAEKYRFDRLIADEGMRMYELLKKYRDDRGSTPYLEREIMLTKKVAMSHPHYLKSQLPEQPSLTEAEMNVLRLLEAGHTNAQIAQITDTTIDNAKFHCKKIFSKLEVSNRYQAVKRAIELGILNPIEI